MLTDKADLVGCECILLAQVQVFILRTLKSFSAGVVSGNSFFSQTHALTQMQHFALGLVKLYEVLVGQLLKLVLVPLDGIPSFCLLHCSASCHLQNC